MSSDDMIRSSIGLTSVFASDVRRKQHLAATLGGVRNRFPNLVETVGGGDRGRDRAGGDQRSQTVEHRRDIIRTGRLIPVAKPEAAYGLLPENQAARRHGQRLPARSELGYRPGCRTPRSGLFSWLLPRGTRSPNRLGYQLLQLAVEHGGNFRDAGLPELAAQRGRPVVLDASLPSLVPVDEHPQRGIEACPNVVPRHLDGEQGVAEEVLDRFLCLAGEVEERSVVAGPEEHEAARPGHPFERGPDGFGVGPPQRL